MIIWIAEYIYGRYESNIFTALHEDREYLTTHILSSLIPQDLNTPDSEGHYWGLIEELDNNTRIAAKHESDVMPHDEEYDLWDAVIYSYDTVSMEKIKY